MGNIEKCPKMGQKRKPAPKPKKLSEVKMRGDKFQSSKIENSNQDSQVKTRTNLQLNGPEILILGFMIIQLFSALSTMAKAKGDPESNSYQHRMVFYFLGHILMPGIAACYVSQKLRGAVTNILMLNFLLIFVLASCCMFLVILQQHDAPEMPDQNGNMKNHCNGYNLATVPLHGLYTSGVFGASLYYSSSLF